MKGFRVTVSLVACAMCGGLLSCVAGSAVGEVIDSGPVEHRETNGEALGERAGLKRSAPARLASDAPGPNGDFASASGG